MKIVYLVVIGISVFTFNSNAQSMEELKAEKANLSVQTAKKQREVDSLKNRITKINKEISILSGWLTGYSGNFGFDFNKSNNWKASPNKDASSSSLNIGLTAYANKVSQKTIWRNKGLISKSWQDVDIKSANGDRERDNLFQNSTVDILNLSSLYGFKYSPKLGITGLAELNTSIEGFLATGTLDFGIGATWTPQENFVLVVHPINYHLGFSSQDGIETAGAFGAKFRVEYTKNIYVIEKELTWSTTLSFFIPYTDKTTTFLEDPSMPDGPKYEAGFFEYTFVNNFRFTLWKGIGVGVGFGFRDADFESRDLQSYYSLGLTYSL